MKRVYVIEIELTEVEAAGCTAEVIEVERQLRYLLGRLPNDGVLADVPLTGTEGKRIGKARVAKRSK